MSVSEVAVKIGMDKATLYRRLADADTFTIGEVTKIESALSLTHTESVAIFLSKKSHTRDF